MVETSPKMFKNVTIKLINYPVKDYQTEFLKNTYICCFKKQRTLKELKSNEQRTISNKYHPMIFNSLKVKNKSGDRTA